MAMRSRNQAAQAAATGQPAPSGGFLGIFGGPSGAQQQRGLPAVSPAASAVPFVPSVTVTGIPPSSAPSPTGSPGPSGISVPQPVWQYGTPVGSFVWKSTGVNSPPGVPAGQIYPGSNGTPVSNPNAFPGFGAFSWQWAPVPAGMSDTQYAQALTSGGSGGWGYAGTGGLANPIGGWTLGWNPAPTRPSVSPGGGWGAGPSVNRTGASRRARRLFGGSGGGAAVNRTGTRATRPLRRRTLSGR